MRTRKCAPRLPSYRANARPSSENISSYPFPTPSKHASANLPNLTPPPSTHYTSTCATASDYYPLPHRADIRFPEVRISPSPSRPPGSRTTTFILTGLERRPAQRGASGFLFLNSGWNGDHAEPLHPFWHLVSQARLNRTTRSPGMQRSVNWLERFEKSQHLFSRQGNLTISKHYPSGADRAPREGGG